MKNKIKQILRENTNEGVTSIKIFDFDDTLVHTELPDTGKIKYEKATGEPYPHVGWWGRSESLDIDIFEHPVNPDIHREWQKAWSERPNTLVVMLTGRRKKLSNEVERILDKYNLKFDKYLYNYGGDTMPNKIEQMGNLLQEYPDVRVITFWDDRKSHWEHFEKFGDDLVNSGRLDKFNMIRVKGSHH